MPDNNHTDNPIGLFGFQNAKDFDAFIKEHEGKKTFNELIQQHIEKEKDEELIAAYLEMELRLLQNLPPPSDEEEANKNNEEWNADRVNTLNRQAQAIATAQAIQARIEAAKEVSELESAKEKLNDQQEALGNKIKSLEKEKEGLEKKYKSYETALKSNALNSLISPSSVAADGTVVPAQVNKDLVAAKNRLLQDEINSLQDELDKAINSDQSPDKLSDILNQLNALSLQDAYLQDLMSVANEEKRYVDGEGRTVGLDNLSKAKFIIGSNQTLALHSETGTYYLFNEKLNKEQINERLRDPAACKEEKLNFDRTKEKIMVLGDLVAHNQKLEQGFFAAEQAKAQVEIGLIGQRLRTIDAKIAALRQSKGKKAGNHVSMSSMPNTCTSLVTGTFKAIRNIFENINSSSQSDNTSLSSAKKAENSRSNSI